MNTQNIYEKKFEGLKNFNLISVVNFNKIPIPEIIEGSFLKKCPEKVFIKRFLGKKLIDNPELPEEVLGAFKESEKEIFSFNGVVYKKVVDSNGDVYYDSFADLTGSVKEIMNIPEIKTLLWLLENSAGKLARIRDLLSMPGFKPIKNEFGEIFFDFCDDNLRGHNLRECKVTLNYVKDDSDSSFSLDLGTLVYFIYRGS